MAYGERRYEDGAALLVAVLILALMGIIGLSSMETVTRDRQVAGYQSRAQTALYAAEAGVAFAMGLLRRDAQDLAEQGVGALDDYDPSSGSPPEFPGGDPSDSGYPTSYTTLGDNFPAPGPPRFYMDPAAEDPNDAGADPQAIRYLGPGDICDGWIMSSESGSTQWKEALWDIRVRGDNPGGTVVDIQATGANCHPYDQG